MNVGYSTDAYTMVCDATHHTCNGTPLKVTIPTKATRIQIQNDPELNDATDYVYIARDAATCTQTACVEKLGPGDVARLDPDQDIYIDGVNGAKVIISYWSTGARE